MNYFTLSHLYLLCRVDKRQPEFSLRNRDEGEKRTCGLVVSGMRPGAMWQPDYSHASTT
jgi:hypothetical protein